MFQVQARNLIKWSTQGHRKDMERTVKKLVKEHPKITFTDVNCPHLQEEPSKHWGFKIDCSMVLYSKSCVQYANMIKIRTVKCDVNRRIKGHLMLLHKQNLLNAVKKEKTPFYSLPSNAFFMNHILSTIWSYYTSSRLNVCNLMFIIAPLYTVQMCMEYENYIFVTSEKNNKNGHVFVEVANLLDKHLSISKQSSSNWQYMDNFSRRLFVTLIFLCF